MQAFFDGGIFNLVGLAAFALGLAALGMQALVRDRTRFPGLNEGMVTGILGIGLLGTWMGALMAMQVVSSLGPHPHLLLAATGTAILPIGFTAFWSAVLYPLGRAVRSPERVEALVRPAPAVRPVTALSAAALLLSLTLGTAFGASVLRAASSGGIGGALSIEILRVAAGLASVGILLSLINVAMGVVGGLRGWVADPA